MESITEYVRGICERAKKASRSLASASAADKNAVLLAVADALEARSEEILAANRVDLDAAGDNGVPPQMLDRLELNPGRIAEIASAARYVASLTDPVGESEGWSRPNGLQITRVRVPIGCVGIIYESRPNVTVDAAMICIKTGNACVLRGGKEALNSNRVTTGIIRDCLAARGLEEDALGFIDLTDREGSTALMKMRGLIDVLIPRGGKSLIRSVVENAAVPVIETGAGNCHMFVDESADLIMAVSVAVNAKTSRPSVCNAIETLLVHRAVAADFLPMLADALSAWKVELRGCPETMAILGSPAVPAAAQDWAEEYDDLILAVRVVGDIDEAIEHISRYGTGHSEAIITRSLDNARRFRREVDAAAVYVNASTRFTDGGCFGFGAEIGISTQKLHARGPMGLRELTTVKYLVDGDGQIR